MDRSPSRAQIVTAFAAIYVIWGSTYLAIRYAIETLPPFLMAGARFMIAGCILYFIARRRGAPPPPRSTWLAGAIAGALLLLGGNGAVVWSEQRVPSGAAALLVATVPLWMVLLESLRPGGERPSRRVIAGVVLGLMGLALLVGPSELAGGGRLDPLGAVVLLVGTLSWAMGSLFSRHAKLPSSPFMTVALEMLFGGTLLLLLGLFTGEGARLDLAAVTARSWLSFLYLVTFGALLGFTAYIWLLKVSTPARVSTYAYVNPVVAVLLGWLLGGETISSRMMIAAGIIVVAVAAITAPSGKQAPRSTQEALKEAPATDVS
jgi:drug/metabolite transporter (DMT)-like permease